MTIYIPKNCPKCTGYMLVDQLDCKQLGCSGGVIMVPDRLVNDVLTMPEHDSFWRKLWRTVRVSG